MRHSVFQRFVAISLAASVSYITIASAAQVMPKSFVDVSQNDWFAPYIHAAVNRGFADGYKDKKGFLNGYFGPGNNVTYAEALSMIMRMAQTDVGGVPYNQSAVGTWAAPYVATAEAMGLTIYGTGLDVNKPISRGAVAQTIMEISKLSPPRGYLHFKDLPETHVYYAAIESLAEAGIIKGNPFTNTISPDAYINRAEICKILSLLSGSVRSSDSSMASSEESSVVPASSQVSSSVPSLPLPVMQIRGDQRIVKQPINVRAGMGMEFKSLLQLPTGSVVNYMGDSGVWSKIQTTDGVSGYVIGKYLVLPAGYVPAATSSSAISLSSSANGLPSVISGSNQWIVSQPIKVRSGASMDSKSIFELPTGTVVTKTDTIGAWAHIQLQDGISGFIVEKYLLQSK